MRHRRRTPFWGLLLGAVLLVACGEEATQPDRSAGAEQLATDVAGGDLDAVFDPEFRGSTIEFADSEVFFEFNSTDNDLGFQLFLDGDAWRRVIVLDPRFRRILDFKGQRQLRELGLTELRFESAEPSPEEVLALFEAGHYTFIGASVEGEKLVGAGTLSLDLPDAPVFTPMEGETVDPEDLTIEWTSIAGISHYEVLVGNEDNGLSLEIELGPDATSVTLPNAFVEEDSEYKAEVIAVSLNGNKTITEAVFFTE